MTFQLVKDSNRTATGAVNTALTERQQNQGMLEKLFLLELPNLLLSYSKPQKIPSVNPNKTRKIANPIKADPPKTAIPISPAKAVAISKIDQAVAATIHTNFYFLSEKYPNKRTNHVTVTKYPNIAPHSFGSKPYSFIMKDCA